MVYLSFGPKRGRMFIEFRHVARHSAESNQKHNTIVYKHLNPTDSFF